MMMTASGSSAVARLRQQLAVPAGHSGGTAEAVVVLEEAGHCVGNERALRGSREMQ